MEDFEEVQPYGDYSDLEDDELLEEIRATEELLSLTNEHAWQTRFQTWLANELSGAILVLENEGASVDQIRAAQGRSNAFKSVLTLNAVLNDKTLELRKELGLRKREEQGQ